MSWAVEMSSAAIRTLDQVPPRVVPAILEFLYGPLTENPRRVRKSLRDDFADTYSARRGAYRVLYTINDSEHSVTVTRIAYRADVYRTR